MNAIMSSSLIGERAICVNAEGSEFLQKGQEYEVTSSRGDAVYIAGTQGRFSCQRFFFPNKKTEIPAETKADISRGDDVVAYNVLSSNTPKIYGKYVSKTLDEKMFIIENDGKVSVWRYIKPAPKYRVRRASEIMAHMEQHDWKVDQHGVFHNARGEVFQPEMLAYCGKYPSKKYKFPDFCLEEI